MKSSHLFEKDNPVAAAAVVESIEIIIARIARFPASAPETEMPGVRMAAVRQFPYLIFYSIESGELVIRNVRHGARRRPWQDAG